MKRNVICLLLLLFLTACGDDSGAKSPATSEFIPTIENFEGSVFSATIATESTRNAGQIGSGLVLQNIDEPVEITFGQSGRDRNFGLTIYYDYEPIEFKVGESEQYADRYEFSIKDFQQINMPVCLSENGVVMDNRCHFLTFVFTPSPDEHAKDKKSFTYDSAQVYNYNLYFGNYDEEKEFVDSKYSLNAADKYAPYESTPLMLNTANNEAMNSDEVYLPNKCYSVDAESLFEMNYVVSNLGGNSETAAIFLEIGNEHIDINGQEYVYVDFNDEMMAIDKLTFTTPENPGVYDVIGFVVYDPFLDVNDNLNQLPETSVRFSLEIIKEK